MSLKDSVFGKYLQRVKSPSLVGLFPFPPRRIKWLRLPYTFKTVHSLGFSPVTQHSVVVRKVMTRI